MQAKKRVSYLLIVFFCLGFCLVVGEDIKDKEEAKQKETGSIIRKELLYRERKELKAPRRNIFSPQVSGSTEENLGTLGVPQGLQEEGSLPEASSSSLSLRYIGYIDAGHRVVALIVFEGQAVAVEEGERINEQFTVGKITTKEIEIIGPGNEKKNYSLEGEEG
jgi:hypothetical protein